MTTAREPNPGVRPKNAFKRPIEVVVPPPVPPSEIVNTPRIASDGLGPDVRRAVPAQMRAKAKAMAQHRSNVWEQERRFLSAWRDNRESRSFRPPATSASDRLQALKRRILCTDPPLDS
jgi:LmbE family N-acetylglucosaminyl deacetylase